MMDRDEIMNSRRSPVSSAQAFVAFGGRANLPWLKLLKPGFRHCFIVLEAVDCWVLYEPLSHRTEITVIPAQPDFDPTAWLRHFDYTVVPAMIHPPLLAAAPWGPFTCVEAVKRVLGIRARFILTPWRLYEFLREQNEKVVDKVKKIGY